MFHGRSGRPYSRRTSFVQIVYRSSESMRRPSMSKRHARIAGRPDLAILYDFVMLVVVVMPEGSIYPHDG